MNKENIEKVTSFIKSICLNSKYELIDVEHLGGSNKSNIVIFIDKEDGVTLDDCIDFNELIHEAGGLDDLIDSSYTLEVSSPGPKRPLKVLSDYVRFKGRKAKVRLSSIDTLSSKKVFVGTIEDVIGDKISINDSGKILATGSVLIIREGYRLEADKVSLDPSKNIIEAEGNIRINEGNGGLITASKIKISSNLNDGIIELPRIVTKDGTVLTSDYAIRNSGKATILRKGLFSPCKKCESNNKRVSWQVRADRIIHDEINGNIIYEGARFELFGIPIFYVPIAGHPSPDIKRRTGFLAPSLVSSGDLGVVLKTPYFINLRQDYDLTITPWIVTKGAFIFENEWIKIEKLNSIESKNIFVPSLDSIQPLVDRISQKILIERLNLPSPRWKPIEEFKSLGDEEIDYWDFPLMIKSYKGGYDGKGNTKINTKKN